MERNEYKSIVEKLNGYCECPELGKLYEQRRKAEFFESKCSQMNKEVDLANPTREDEKFLLEFKGVSERLFEEIMKYYSLLTENIKTGNVKQFLRYSQEFGRDKYLTARDAHNIIQADKEAVITLHCSRCNQQIDLMARVLSSF